MPRRTSTRTVTSSATPQAPTTPHHLETPYDSNIYQLRRHWKWAAFSQFFFTFSPVVAMADVTLTDVENDLVHSTNRVLPRVMQRLLIALTQDRKITIDSWQNALRRQYQRRDPEASPIGLMSRFQYSTLESSRASPVLPHAVSEAPPDEAEQLNESLERNHSTPPSPDDMIHAQGLAGDSEHDSTTKVEEKDTSELLDEPEKQIDWRDLSMLVKLDSLHTLAEWQFQNPHRIRQQMKDDDEQATWRIEPIGYDAKRNAYWLIGGDRLWIQREPPRPNLKRKRKLGGNTRNAAKKQQTSKRQRIEPSSSILSSAVVRSTRSRAQLPPTNRKEGRAAKLRANQKLDAQARDVAEFRRQMSGSRARGTSVTPRKPTGIRVSARLRGTAVEDDEWQEVPDEWLSPGDTRRGHTKDPPSSPLPIGKKTMRTGLESEGGSISELTELSEDDTAEIERDPYDDPAVETESVSNEQDAKAEIEAEQEEEAKPVDLSTMSTHPDDFIEWETICVTLEEWESVAQQFEKATHYAEKALHKVLLHTIVPMVTDELREAERRRRAEDTVVHRKRSSRIAMKEIEKEEERAAMRRRLEEEEKTSRARRLEARQQKEQVERLRRENAREQRRKERESREQQSDEMCEADPKPDALVNVIQDPTSLPAGQCGLDAAPINGANGEVRSVENFELDCEVCGRKGFNQDGGSPLLCCGLCGKWQHIVCHDRQDAVAGRSKRNWDAEVFVCRKCCLMSSKSSSSSSHASLLSRVNHNLDQSGGQAVGTQAYFVPPSDHRSYTNGHYHQDSSGYGGDSPDFRTTVPSPSPHSYPRSTGVTFAHYQPQRGGFSTSRPTYSLQDANPSHHARYNVSPQTISTTSGMTAYPSAVHPQTIPHPPGHEQWHPRTTNLYPINGVPLHSQGAQMYYNGHGHTPYSHMRGTTSQGVLGQYPGLQHVPSYQHSK